MTSIETPGTPTVTVTTAGGELRGETQAGIHTFKGIPYGAPTGGANRFLPPRKAEPWSGIREARATAISSSTRSPSVAGMGATE